MKYARTADTVFNLVMLACLLSGNLLAGHIATAICLVAAVFYLGMLMNRSFRNRVLGPQPQNIAGNATAAIVAVALAATGHPVAALLYGFAVMVEVVYQQPPHGHSHHRPLTDI